MDIKKLLTNNIGLKIASIFIAVLVWVVVVNVSNPEVTATKTCQVEVVNEGVILEMGKTYEFLGNTTVSVQYTVRNRDAYLIKASDFRVYVDMKDLYAVTGSVPVKVEIVNNRDLFTDTPFAKPGVLQVAVEDVLRNTFQIEVVTEGEPVEGYTIGSINTDPASVTLKGPQSIIGRIASAKINVNVDGIGEDTSGTAKPLFFDAGGNRVIIDDDRVTVNNQEIKYFVTTLSGKTIPVKYSVTGKPEDGYEFVGINASINELTIMGTKEQLETIDSVEVPSEILRMDKFTSDRSFSIDLTKYLPEGIQVMGETQSLVIVMIKATNEKTFTLGMNEIQFINPEKNYTYEISPAEIDVTLSGVQEMLNMLTPADIKASIDCVGIKDMNIPGVISFELPSGCAIKSYTPFNLLSFTKDTEAEVRAGISPGAETEAETETTEEEKPKESKKENQPETTPEESSAAPESNADHTEKTEHTEHTEHTDEAGNAADRDNTETLPAAPEMNENEE